MRNRIIEKKGNDVHCGIKFSPLPQLSQWKKFSLPPVLCKQIQENTIKKVFCNRLF